MAASEILICNLALAKLGTGLIMSLDDASPVARACKLMYGPTRDQVLRGHRWNFAMKRATLSQLADPPAFGWALQYSLPTDCLRVFQLNAFESDEARPKWEIEGGNLLTDQDTAQIKYVAQITNASLFDPIFIKALATKLAAEMAKTITGSNSIAGDLLTEYERVTGPEARMADAMESRPKRKFPWVESNLVRSRFGGH
jgi:hypothetical protein